MKLIKLSEVEALVGLKKSKIYALIQKGTFPSPVKVGRSSSWLVAEVEEWIALHAMLRTTPKDAALQILAAARPGNLPTPASS